MEPQISVLISTYQRYDQLRSCLNAISLQTIADNVEVCIVNDGGYPIDGVVGEFPNLHIRHHNLAQNLGQVASRNIALSLAKGQWIAICDDDDRYTPNHLEQLYLASTEQSAQFIYSDAELVCLDFELDFPAIQGIRQFAWHDAKRLLREYNPIIPSSIFYHRLIHDRIGNFDEAMGHYWDWDFFLRAASCTEFKRIPKASLLYGIDARGSNQSANPLNMRDKLVALIDKHHLGELPSSNFWRMTEDPNLYHAQATSERVWDMDLNIWQ